MKSIGTHLLMAAISCMVPTVLLADGSPVPTVRLATFRCDVTPPLGGRFAGGWMQPLTKLEAPLWAKGIVLEDEHGRYVLCALDWCALSGLAHTVFCRELAEAAGTEISRVAVQSVHQHTAPYVDGDAQALLDQAERPPTYADLKSLEALAERLGTAVKEALGKMQPVDRIGTGESRAERIAATRRVLGPDGKVRVRWSSCTDPELRAAPEGDIDPMLKSITFARGDKPLVRLHYYATHPQTGGGDGWVGIDFVGDARERLERQEGVMQIYFTGCAGDVTAGKYNDGSPQARQELAERLLAAMRASIAATKTAPITAVAWRTLPLALPARTDAGFTLEENRAVLANPKSPGPARVDAASRVAFHERSGRPIQLSVLEIGAVRVLHLPGEPMVEFQQFAQKAAPGCFVAVAGYGDGATGYLCTEESYAQGGYEPTATLVAPNGETVLKGAIRQLLSRN
ncbi:MAG: hypothetical protein HUU20_19130 [Pirellulales bacterium]|nr:hypothetical protein [Pirellulales bacterium]